MVQKIPQAAEPEVDSESIFRQETFAHNYPDKPIFVGVDYATGRDKSVITIHHPGITTDELRERLEKMVGHGGC